MSHMPLLDLKFGVGLLPWPLQTLSPKASYNLGAKISLARRTMIPHSPGCNPALQLRSRYQELDEGEKTDSILNKPP